MAQGYSVESEELLAHAATLEALADRMQSVGEASQYITFDYEAYGVYCAWMGLVMIGRQFTQVELVAAVQANLTAAAGELRAAAAAYDDTDAVVEQELQGLLAELEG
ncbi:type VII secretion target [Glycomyces sp. NPDC046736]|uniref:type VII secretion target n=1 Tax=Glycomyces sp. NPDC046736 TaxID=3155615 RepID=UPI0033F69535